MPAFGLRSQCINAAFVDLSHPMADQAGRGQSTFLGKSMLGFASFMTSKDLLLRVEGILILCWFAHKT